MALAVAREPAACGKQVLVLCFTEPLERRLREQTRAPDPAVWVIKRYTVDLLTQAGLSPSIDETPEFRFGVALEAVTEALPRLNPAWDALVVDESQDLVEEDCLLIEELSLLSGTSPAAP